MPTNQMAVLMTRASYILSVLLVFLSCSEEPDNPGINEIIIEDSDPIVDIEGNNYETVKIGDEIWMVENLDVSHFRNGDTIPEARSAEEWIQAGDDREPAWCHYDNDPKNGETFG